MLMRFRDVNRTFAALDELRRRMDGLFDEYEYRGGSFPGRALFSFDPAEVSATAKTVATWPRLSVYDNGPALILAADVPGMEEGDIKLEIDQDVLTLSGKRRAEVPEGYAVHRRERATLEFSRSVALPCKVDAAKASAVLRDGVLSLTLPKSPEAQPRKIAVKAAS